MTDNPTTEVLRRAEKRRDFLTSTIVLLEREIGGFETQLAAARSALAQARGQLDVLEHIIEPFADQEVAWRDTEKAQPWCETEQRRARRNLSALVLETVGNYPGRNIEQIAQLIPTRTSPHAHRERIEELLATHEKANRIEWRDGEGWYRTGTNLVPNITSHPFPLAAPQVVDADPDPRQAALEKPQEDDVFHEEGQQGQQSITLVQGYEECQRDAQALSEALGVPQGDDTDKHEAAIQEPPASPATPTPEVTLDYIRRAGPPGLSDFQLRKHVHNLPGLIERGVIECNQDGRTRYVDKAEAAK